MSDAMITIYTAPDFAEAQMIREALAEADIEAFVDQTPSPLDGLNAMNQGTPVMVEEKDVEAAQRIVAEFLAEQEEQA